MSETWKDIPGYEGKYQASTQGRIRSLDRWLTGRNWNTGKPFKRLMRGRILRPGANHKDGHQYVVLGHGKHGSLVHYLVMLTFVGERSNGMDIRHLNGNPQDNRLENLAYGTRTDNILDVYRIGKRWRKFSIQDIRSIRTLLELGLSATEVAQEMNCSLSTICNIRKGRTYRWLK